jgi:hypothetical protein
MSDNGRFLSQKGIVRRFGIPYCTLKRICKSG